ncbi:MULTISPECIES: SDR family oxidoreductase [unclassified Roseitalea]|uniref:SDR family oxidoreductase n=1 Tax=unclassified Roseitalea TaxID=2639107 RepID=UPI00273E42BF|nr:MULTISPECIES: SDR family oxidoreductase [unclassified Roseitalea]
MPGRLEGRIAVVTAAGQGIGKAIADRFVAEGATVWASDLDADRLTDAAYADARRLDVTDTAAIEAYAARIGPIDVLANVAGWVHHGTVLDCAEADWDRSFDVNVKSAHRTIRAFLPALLERAERTGRTTSIINLASGAATRALPNRYAYAASKAAMVAMTKAVAIDFAARQVRCNAISPGTVDSPSLRERVAALGETLGGYEIAWQQFVDRQPMGRLATPQEIAALAVYLASDEAAFVTGADMPVDGGFGA